MRNPARPIFFQPTIIAWIILPLVFAVVSRAEEHVFYSLQVASFQQLENANRQINQLKERERHVFWKQVEIPGQGVLYRVYLGRFDSPDAAVSYWKNLEKQGVVTDLVVHRFVESLPEKPAGKPETRVLSKPAARQGNRFIDNHDGTVTDTTMGLMWARNGWMMEFFAAINWWAAREQVTHLRLGGFDDWRLPTIQEWMSLIDTGREYPAIVEPNLFVNIITHMPYWSASVYSYAPQADCDPNCPGHAYAVMLYSGNIQRINKKENGFVLPVRETGKP